MKYKQLECPDHGVVALREYDIPAELGDHEVLVRCTNGAEKHGTVEAFVHKSGNTRGAWDVERGMHLPGEGVTWPYPIPLGNMQVGYVERIGSAVSRYKMGHRVLLHGAFAPFQVITEESGWIIGEDVDWKTATCLDPASYALCALRDGNTRIGDAVAVFGLGAIGLTAVSLAGLAGCSPIVAVDPISKRRELARSLGADETLDPTSVDAGEKIHETTGWRGVDVAIEYSASVHALNAALRGVAFGGTVVCGGFPSPYPTGLDLGAEAHMNRPQIVFSRTESEPNRDHPRWDHARVRESVLKLIVAGTVDWSEIVQPVIPFQADFASKYEAVVSDPESGVKLGVVYETSSL